MFSVTQRMSKNYQHKKYYETFIIKLGIDMVDQAVYQSSDCELKFDTI
jgi:hypothetical protein